MLNHGDEAVTVGSPPRVRGEGGGKSKTPIGHRITPACAGRSNGVPSDRVDLEDHPRVCGEKDARIRTGVFWAGSPPRVRGEVQVMKYMLARQRITPACAGRRATGRRTPISRGDHPRVCGEKFNSSILRAFALGSPPRVRGEVRRCYYGSRRPRITPACAGRSFPLYDWRTEDEDHPRVCGEKLSVENGQRTGHGSPPRVRGEVHLLPCRLQQQRITPACAGRSLGVELLLKMREDHPRVCGEKSSVMIVKLPRKGSPPRVRGEGERIGHFEKLARITPACAGRSPIHRGNIYRGWDHPRVCGEKRKTSPPQKSKRGSPPRVRGEAHFLK